MERKSVYLAQYAARKERGQVTIQIHGSTRDRLQDIGKKGESYDDVIKRLLEEHKEKEC